MNIRRSSFSRSPSPEKILENNNNNIEYKNNLNNKLINNTYENNKINYLYNTNIKLLENNLINSNLKNNLVDDNKCNNIDNNNGINNNVMHVDNDINKIINIDNNKDSRNNFNINNNVDINNNNIDVNNNNIDVNNNNNNIDINNNNNENENNNNNGNENNNKLKEIIYKEFNNNDDIDDIFASDSDHSFINKKSCKNLTYRLECDDEEGYYVSYIGEIIGNKYIVNSNSIGKGVFSCVVKCIDIETEKEVAIKIIRLNDMMRSSGEKEYLILKQFIGVSNIVQVETSFIHKNHLCLVFEWLEGPLKNYINNTFKFNIKKIQDLAFQLFQGIKIIHDKGFIHADLKPENILIDIEKNIKISDFGSILTTIETSPTCYLVSRFYRAPEIILGYIKYGQPIDIWSIGCVLYECFTGNILFNGKTNNDMIKLIMEYKGNIPKRILKQGIFTNNHFSDCYNKFKWKNEHNMIQIIQDFRPKYNICNSILDKINSSSKVLNNIEYISLRKFSNLIEKCLILDPKKRITANEALKDTFFSFKIK